MTTKRNKQVVFARPNGWQQITVELRVGLDVQKPPYYVLELFGLRHDGNPFHVAIDIDKRIDHAPGSTGLMVAVRGIQDNLKKLGTYRDCECGPEKSCQEHRVQ